MIGFFPTTFKALIFTGSTTRYYIFESHDDVFEWKNNSRINLRAVCDRIVKKPVIKYPTAPGELQNLFTLICLSLMITT